MTSADQRIIAHIPTLRRYARCLTGAQERGDRYVRACLETVLADPSIIEDEADARVGLFRAFHGLLVGLLVPHEADAVPSRGGLDKLELHIRALPETEREVLLLRTLCNFALDEIAAILRLSSHEARNVLERARSDLCAQTATRALIIEDEPVIAFDLASIVNEMGHSVVGIADTRARALALAASARPGIVLADIQLKDGSSGIDAVDQIRAFADVPVIFITAYPERLLTGARGEPTYLVTKPFDADELEVMISQALLLHPAMPATAAG